MGGHVLGAIKTAGAHVALKCVQALGWAYFLAPRFLRQWADAFLARTLTSYRKNVILENLKRAYPTLSPEALQQEARLFREEFARTLWGMVMVFGPHRQWVQKYVKTPDLSPAHEALRLGRSRGTGFIFLTGHFCNWEQAAAAMGLAGFETVMVTKPLKSKVFNDRFEKSRRACNVKPTYEPRTLIDVLTHLKKGNVVGMVLDQYAGPPVNVRVPFFGTYVGTHRAVAAIIKRTGAPVVFGRILRNEAGELITIGEPVMDFKPLFDHAAASADPDRATEEAIIKCTAFLTARLEASVRRTPSQWLWSHRRFKGDLSPPPKTSELNYAHHESSGTTPLARGPQNNLHP